MSRHPLPAKLTPEDLYIWVGRARVLRDRSLGNSWALCMVHDRRDASVMLLAQQSPHARFVSSIPFAGFWAVSMVAFASEVHRWVLVRRKSDPFYTECIVPEYVL